MTEESSVSRTAVLLELGRMVLWEGLVRVTKPIVWLAMLLAIFSMAVLLFQAAVGLTPGLNPITPPTRVPPIVSAAAEVAWWIGVAVAWILLAWVGIAALVLAWETAEVRVQEREADD